MTTLSRQLYDTRVKTPCRPSYRPIDHSDVVSMGGFIGKTVDGLETTYERGGSDRTAVDIAIYSMTITMSRSTLKRIAQS